MRNRLRELRERAGLTQEALGALVGHDKTVISRLELGKRRMTLQWIKKFADALNVSPTELISLPLQDLVGEKGDYYVPQEAAQGIRKRAIEAEKDAPGHHIDMFAGGGTLVAERPVTQKIKTAEEKQRLKEKSGIIVEVDSVEYTRIPRFDAALSAGPGSLIDPAAEPVGYHLVESQWLRTVTRSLPGQLALLRISGDSMESTLLDGDWVLIDRGQTRLSREGIYALRVFDDCWVKRLTLNLADQRVRIISDNPRYPMQELREDDLALIGRVVWIVGRRM